MGLNSVGFEIVKHVLTLEEVESITRELACVNIQGGGIRNAEKKLQSVYGLVENANILALVSKYLAGEIKLVRSILFSKSLENNWSVAWHQDKTIAISKRFEHPQWGPWSEKEGILHVQPPLEVLKQMVTLRIQLDDATEDNGCLRVIPNSHRLGLLTQQAIQSYVDSAQIVNCIAPVGSALVMRPHILHASNKVTAPTPRRVLHLEFCSFSLPCGANWA